MKSIFFPTFVVILLGCVVPLRAEVTVTVVETPSGVVFTGTGTLNLSDLSKLGGQPAFGGSVSADFSSLAVGPPDNSPPTDAYEYYGSVSDPGSFSIAMPAGGTTNASSGSGDYFGLSGPNVLIVPTDYVNGTLINTMSTYDGATLQSLDLEPGVYVWTWGSGDNADRFTLVIDGKTPVVKYKSPRKNSILKKRAIHKGNASDDSEVSKVEYKWTRGSWRKAQLRNGTQWSFPVKARNRDFKGKRKIVILVRATDKAGKVSRSVRRVFRRS